MDFRYEPVTAGKSAESGLTLHYAGDFLKGIFGFPESQQHLCEGPLEAPDIVLRVLSEPTQDKFQDTVFGFAVVPILASVYYDYALGTAKRDNAEFEAPIILACVIAHEIGHLLLGPNSHSGSE